MPIVTKGVKYIAINRIDTDGRDNTLSLQELTNIRIKYDDIGIVDYPVYQITEYPTYYLYQIYTTNLTSSIDNNINNYNALIVTGSQFRAQTTINPSIFTISSVTTDNMGFFDGVTYTFNGTPNIPVTIRFATTSSINSPTFYIWSSINGNIASAGVTAGSCDFSYTGFFQHAESIYIRYGSIGLDFSSSNSQLFVTQSISPTSSNNLVVFEPYLEENFEVSDCNVMMNNVSKYPINDFYMDVDYSLNPIIATNFNQIISESAVKATVKPYYYSLRRHIYPRYNGTRVNSAYYNVYTSASTIYFINGDSGSYSGDVSYGQTPNIKYESSALFEFEWGGSTYPEIYGAGAFYLGNIINVEDINRANRKTTSSKNRQRREVELISPSNIKSYDNTIHSDLYPNTQVKIQQYETAIKVSSKLRVIANDFSVPGVSSYMISNNNNHAAPNSAYQDSTFNNIITFATASEVTINNGFYTQGALISGSEMVSEISESISNGNRWFVTIYRNLSSPISGTLKPYNHKRNQIDPATGDYKYPLENKGVYEIQSTSGSISIVLTSDVPQDTNNDPIQFGRGDYGSPLLPSKTILIWKAINPGNGQNKYLIVDGDTLSGVGKGALSKLYTKDDIQNYFNYITSTYGNNPKTGFNGNNGLNLNDNIGDEGGGGGRN